MCNKSVVPRQAEGDTHLLLLEARVSACHDGHRGESQVQAIHMVLAEGGQTDLQGKEGGYGPRGME